MTDIIYNKLVIAGRVFALTVYTTVVCVFAGALGAWLHDQKYAPQPIVVSEPNTEREDQLRQELQAARTQMAKERADYKKAIANLKAQAHERVSKIQDTETQLDVLHTAAKASATLPLTISDHELERKTHELLGVSGKVVRP